MKKQWQEYLLAKDPRGNHKAPWMDVAESYVGIKEIPGKKANWLILKMLSLMENIGLRARSTDETPWCSAFVNHCLVEVGIEGTNHALARSWIRWGAASKANRGAIIVVQRKAGKDEVTGSRGGFHVGFLTRITRLHYVILGGNQRNGVNTRLFPKEKYELKALRKPTPVG